MTRVLLAVTSRLIPRRVRGDVVGDLREEHARHIRAERGTFAAAVWLLAHTLRAARDTRLAQIHRRLESLRTNPPGLDGMHSLWIDLRYAARSLRRAPYFTGLALAMCTLGLGANLISFALLDAAMLRGLPYPGSERLVEPRLGDRARVSRAVVERLSEDLTALDSLVAYAGYDLTLLGDGEPIVLDGERTTAGLLDIIGAPIQVGRTLAAADYVPGAEPVVVISDRLWREQFGGDPGIVGRAIALDGGGVAARTVVGVMDSDFRPLLGPERSFWIPLPAGQEGAFLRMVGTVRPGVTVDEATAELKVAADALVADDFVRYAVDGARVLTLADAVSGSAGRLLSLLWTAAIGVLLLSCANFVNLLFARWGRRRPELDVRQAVGASRSSVRRQLLLESMLLALAGLVVALPAVVYLAPWLGTRLEVPGDPPELRVITLLFAVGLALAVGLLCGLLPARRTLGRRRARNGRSRDLLIGAQIAVSLVVVVGAGLVLRSAERVAAIESGFDPGSVALMQLSPLESRYAEPEQRIAFYDDVLGRIAAIPGVVAAGTSQIRPMTLENWSLPYHVEGMDLAEGESAFVAMRITSPGYHDAVGETLVAGRRFDSADGQGVVVINAALAREHWGEPGAAVGSTLRLYQADGPELQILGVVSDVRQHQLETVPEPALYLPFAASPRVGMHLAVRLSREPLAALEEIKQAVWDVDPAVPILGAQTFAQAVDASLGERRALSSMLGALAALSLGLAAAGVYSVMSLVVLRHRREIAIRMAVGAAPGRVVRVMSTRVVTVVVVGLLVGLGTALVAWTSFESLLFETRATDPVILIGAMLVISIVALMASVLPLARAARISPAALLASD